MAKSKIKKIFVSNLVAVLTFFVWSAFNFSCCEQTFYENCPISKKPGVIFKKHPQDASGSIGEEVCFSTEVESDGDLSYQWQVSKPIGDVVGVFTEWENIPGATEREYRFIASQEFDGNRYRCVVTATKKEN